MLAPGLPGPDPDDFLFVQKVIKDTPKGKGPFARSSPLGNPHSFGRPKRGLRPPFWIFPGGLILRWKTAIPASVSGFGLVRYESACGERGFWFVRIGVAYFFLSACALRSRWRLCRLTDAAYPLRVLRAFGADAVRECLRWFVHGGTSIAGCSDLLLCKKYALKRTTPSIAADRCR